MRFILCIALFMQGNFLVSAQTASIDSLERVLLTTRQDDTLRMLVLNKLVFAYFNQDIKISLSRGWEAVHLAHTNGKPVWLNKAYTALGIAYSLAGNQDSARYHLTEGLRYAEEGHLPEKIMNGCLNLGIHYSSVDNFDQALALYMKGLDVADQYHFSKEDLYGSIATVYQGLENYQESIRYNQMALQEVYRAKVGKAREMLIKGNLAHSLWKANRYHEARTMLLECIRFHESTQDYFYLANHYQVLSELESKAGQYERAYQYARKSLMINRKLGNVQEVAEGLLVLGGLAFQLKYIDEAQQLAIRGYEMADSLHAHRLMMNGNTLMMKIALYNHDFPNMVHYDTLAATLQDSLNFQEQNKLVAELDRKYETQKRERENKLLQETQKRQEAELKQQRYINIIIVLSLVAVSVLLIFVYRSKQQSVRTSRVLAAQREAISQQNTALQTAIQDLKNAQTQLVQSEKMASLGQMTAGIAHELNNPLNFISGGVEGLNSSLNDYISLRQHELTESQRREHEAELQQEIKILLTSVGNGVHRAHKIINSLRLLSSPHTESMRAFDLNESIEVALTVLNSKFKMDNVDVVLRLADQTLMVMGNISQLTQVFTNLLDNAWYAVQDRDVRRVEVETRLHDGYITAIISDTGTGIPEDIRGRVMDPFFTTKPVDKGSGLGLSISYRIVEKHEGQITFESVTGEYTRFYVRLKQFRDE